MTVRRTLVTLLVAFLTACGGSDGGSTPLPATLVLSVPATRQALGVTISFASNTSEPALSYRWDFGDGTTSTLVAPTHAYSMAGVYTVRLTLSNDSGGSISTADTVTIADFAIVAGKACSGPGSSGWCWQRPLPQGNYIADYAFIDDTRGWAVGDGGTILATGDAGVTWNAQMSGTQLFVGQVKFASALTGWAASSNGELLKTADAGATWQRLSFGQNDSVDVLGVTDASTAWVTTFSGAAYVTQDGGSHWRFVSAPPGGSYRFVLIGASDIWSLPYFSGDPPTLAHSLDGGATWSNVALPPIESGLSGQSQSLQFSDASHGLLTGYESGYRTADPLNFISRQTLRITADRGTSWQTVALPPGGGFGNTYVLAERTTVFTFFNGSSLQRTSDNGVTWQTVALPPSASYVATFKAFSAQRLIVTDGSGQTYLTTDGGTHWNLLGASGATGSALNSVWFFDSHEGLAFGDDGSVVRTNDAGQTWVTTAGTGFGWRRAQFLADGSVGWIISDSGTLYRTTDKGKVWLSPVASTSATMYGVADFHFVDPTHGWAVTPYSFTGQGTFFTTSDGGSSWQAIAGTTTTSGFVALRFADAMHGVAVGPAGIAMLTDDGGATWSPRPTGVTGSLRRVTFVDATTAVAVGDGGAIVRSTDRGRNWTPVDSPTTRTLTDVRFVSTSVGHAVGDGGTQLVTHDGGASWTSVPTHVQASLQAVFFIDQQTGWLVGGNGSILATVTGGR